jgi:hypothetical protein
MALYEYKCPKGHITTRQYSIKVERPEQIVCDRDYLKIDTDLELDPCFEMAERAISRSSFRMY